MFRNGQFQDIEWDNFAEKHKKHWQILSEKYGLTLAKVDSQMDDKAPKSLDFLAQQCIQLCSPYLWGMEGYARELDSRLRYDMQNYLEASLCDHLIVTFAYRFYCENLASESREQYWKKVQDDDKGYEKSVSSFHTKYRDYEAGIEEIVGTYQTMMQTDLEAARNRIGSSPSNLKPANDLQGHHQNARILAQLAANMRDAHQFELEELKKRGQVVKKAKNLLDSGRFKEENLSAPNWGLLRNPVRKGVKRKKREKRLKTAFITLLIQKHMGKTRPIPVAIWRRRLAKCKGFEAFSVKTLAF